MNQAQSLQSFNRLTRISGDLTHIDNVMNNTFWIGVQPALTREMLEFAAAKI
jgi:CDP-6-deoxy-D-xylo-4-hexulose-3-dehydrase